MIIKIVLLVLAALATILAATEEKNLSMRAKLSIWIAVAISACSITIVVDESKDQESLQGNAIVRGLSAARSAMHALDLTVVKLGSYDPKGRESARPEFYVDEHERAEGEISEVLVTYSDALSGEQREVLIDMRTLISQVISIGEKLILRELVRK